MAQMSWIKLKIIAHFGSLFFAWKYRAQRSHEFVEGYLLRVCFIPLKQAI